MQYTKLHECACKESPHEFHYFEVRLGCVSFVVVCLKIFLAGQWKLTHESFSIVALLAIFEVFHFHNFCGAFLSVKIKWLATIPTTLPSR